MKGACQHSFKKPSQIHSRNPLIPLGRDKASQAFAKLLFFERKLAAHVE
jgi:hypothetical protein